MTSMNMKRYLLSFQFKMMKNTRVSAVKHFLILLRDTLVAIKLQMCLQHHQRTNVREF